jgi:hypothetical protein
MTRPAQVMVLVALAAVVLVPVATLHALQLHVTETHAHRPHGTLPDAHMLLLASLFVASLAPLFGLLLAVVRWARGMRSLRRLAAASEEASFNGHPYRRVHGAAPALFTAGIRRSAIYASAPAEAWLSPGAFAAALHHEAAHQQHRDVAWKFLIHLARGAFGWIPGVSRALDRQLLRMECRADDDALAAGASRKHLFDAIALVARGAQPSASLAGEDVLFRLERLTRAEPSMPRPLTGRIGGAMVAVLALPVAAHLLLVAICDVHLIRI